MPVMTKFDSILEALLLEKDQNRQHILAECLNHAMAVTRYGFFASVPSHHVHFYAVDKSRNSKFRNFSRTSKAFSNQQTMKSCGCVQPYLDILHVFLRSLQVSHFNPPFSSFHKEISLWQHCATLCRFLTSSSCCSRASGNFSIGWSSASRMRSCRTFQPPRRIC